MRSASHLFFPLLVAVGAELVGEVLAALVGFLGCGLGERESDEGSRSCLTILDGVLKWC